MSNTVNNNYQRKGAKSNTQVGRDFEEKAREYLENELGVSFDVTTDIEIGLQDKKEHAFDLVCRETKIVVECKSHTWTEGQNVPSAKITTWIKEMYYFHLLSSDFRKIFFFKKDVSEKRRESLGEYFIRNNKHLIPADVEFWEYDEDKNTAYILERKES